MSRSSTARIVALGVVILTMLLTACQPAAAPAAPTAAPAVPTATQPAAQPTAAPTETTAPTVAATTAPTNTAAAAAPTATTAPQPTATTPAAVCAPLPTLPTVKAGDLGSSDNPLVIAFVPSGDTGKITTAGNEIADCLGKMTGLSFKIEVGTSYAASIEAMGANKAQIGFLNTFSVLLAEQKYGIVPGSAHLRKYATNDVDPDKSLAGQMEPFYKGQFITQATSGIKTLADLKGKSFCFVDPNSTSGYIIPRIVLKANGIDPDKDLSNTTDAGSHNNVAIAVYKGDCDAGVTYINVMTDASANLAAQYPDIATKVVPFYDTVRIPNDGVQVTKDLNPDVKTAVVAGLMNMSKDPGGAAFLTALYNINGFQEIQPDFYNEFANVLKQAGVNPADLVK